MSNRTIRTRQAALDCAHRRFRQRGRSRPLLGLRPARPAPVRPGSCRLTFRAEAALGHPWPSRHLCIHARRRCAPCAERRAPRTPFSIRLRTARVTRLAWAFGPASLAPLAAPCRPFARSRLPCSASLANRASQACARPAFASWLRSAAVGSVLGPSRALHLRPCARVAPRALTPLRCVRCRAPIRQLRAGQGPRRASRCS